MAKLVGSTVVATLIVLGVVGYWVASRDARGRAQTPAPAASVSHVTTTNPPKAGGPGIRPIHASDTEPPRAVDPSPPAVDPSPAPSTATAPDHFDREAAEKRVRAARLERARDNPSTKARRGTRATHEKGATATASAGGLSGSGSGASSSPKPLTPVVGQTAPPPATSPSSSPANPAPTRADPASNVVDGRRIRTSL